MTDTNPRYRWENVLTMKLDGPERHTEEFSDHSMRSKVEPILRMNMNKDSSDEDIRFASVPNPYKKYSQEAAAAEASAVTDMSSATRNEDRPSSAPRQRRVRK